MDEMQENDEFLEGVNDSLTLSSEREKLSEGPLSVFSQKSLLGILLFGLMVSAFLFWYSVHLKDKKLGEDYGQISRKASESIVREFYLLEEALKNATIFSSSLMDSSYQLADLKVQVQDLNDLSERYDAIYMYYRGAQGARGSFSPLFNQFTDRGIFSAPEFWKSSQVAQALKDGITHQGEITIRTKLSSPYDQEVLKTGEGSNYLLLVYAAKTRDGSDIVLLGISSFDRLIARDDVQLDPLVARIDISDIAQNDQLLSYERVMKNGDSRNLYPALSGYDFRIGDRVFEIETRLFKKSDFFFVAAFPYLAVFPGITITLAAVFCFYLRRRQIDDVNQIKHDLLQKSDELKKEIRKRELLNKTARLADRENKAIIDSVSDIIFETDEQGRFLFLNAQWQKITGFSKGQSVGLDLFSIIHGQDKEEVQSQFSALLERKIDHIRKFTRIRTSSGAFRAAELSISLIQKSDTNEKRVVGTFTDIEERRKAERALSEAERKYRNIVQNAAGGIFQLTPEGIYLSANPAMAKILGYNSPDQVLAVVKNAKLDVYVDAHACDNLFRDLEKNDAVVNYEAQLRRKDGTIFWANQNIHTVRDDAGHVLYFEGSLEDISERKEAALALSEAKLSSDLASRAKSEFLTNMSHELRTPLNSIIGFSEMIKNEVYGPLEQRSYWEYAKDINQSGKHLLNVINEILDISKIEAGERQLTESQVHIDQVASTCLDLMQIKIENAKVVVHNNLAFIPAIVGESLAVKQILMNLLSNAVKFTPKGGRVSLSYEHARDGQLHISVTDTGIGLDDDEIEKALSPFGQLDNDLSRRGSGAGLGLTLVDSLMKLHGGRLELISQKGIGTTATIIFPSNRVLPGQSSDTAPQDDTVSETVEEDVPSQEDASQADD